MRPLIVFIVLVLLPAWQAGPPRLRDRAAPLAESAAAPAALPGGRPGARALVIALHGGSFAGAGPMQLAERCRDELTEAARDEGLRLLVPVAPEQEASASLGTPAWPERSPPSLARASSADRTYQVPWLQPAGESRVLALIEEEVSSRRADATRIYLAGRGAGATGALLLAARHADRIAGVAAWAGTPAPLWDAGRRVIGLAEDPVPALAGMPVFLWTARDDALLDRGALALFTRGLRSQRDPARQQRGAPPPPLVLLEEDSGGHGYGAAGPGPGLRFLHAQRRKAAR